MGELVNFFSLSVVPMSYDVSCTLTDNVCLFRIIEWLLSFLWND